MGRDRVREMELPPGQVTLLVEALADGGGDPDEGWVRVRVVAWEDTFGRRHDWDGPTGWPKGDVSRWTRASRWWVTTVMEPEGQPAGRSPPGRYVAWGGDVDEARPAGTSGGWLGTMVGQVRDGIIGRLRPDAGRGSALLSGFLLGDTTHLREVDRERMRRSGLSHFVAVFGSNVAMFLGALFVMAGPFGWSSRRRAIIGLAGLVFFVLLIGPDPSVLCGLR